MGGRTASIAATATVARHAVEQQVLPLRTCVGVNVSSVPQPLQGADNVSFSDVFRLDIPHVLDPDLVVLGADERVAVRNHAHKGLVQVLTHPANDTPPLKRLPHHVERKSEGRSTFVDDVPDGHRAHIRLNKRLGREALVCDDEVGLQLLEQVGALRNRELRVRDDVEVERDAKVLLEPCNLMVKRKLERGRDHQHRALRPHNGGCEQRKKRLP
jgi:hypothetical protein